MTTTRHLATVLTLTAAAVAANAFGVAARAATTEPAQPATGIPNGRYTRVATTADGATLGMDPALVDAMTGPDGEMPLAIELDGDRYTLYVTNDAGVEEVGTAGSASVDEDGHLVTTEDCCPGTTVTEAEFADGVLTLSLLPIDGVTYPPDQRFVIEGTWVLQTAPDSEGDEPVLTLRFANLVDAVPEQIVRFATEVQRLSEGTLDFEFVNDYGADTAAGAEPTTIADIASGEVDMGWVGARALPAFEPLLAPMLVDSYDLEEAVFDAGIPQRMLADVGEPGLVGITIMPGPLRTVLGVTHPFLGPDDFAEQTIASDMVPLNELSMTTLGATPVPGAQGLSLDGLDGLQAHLAAITGNGYHTRADSVTANLNLWPRPLVILMNVDRFATLTPEQQEVLTTAGANAVEPAMEASRNEHLLAVPAICDSQLDVVEASDEDLEALRSAFGPVYEWLADDPVKAAYVDEITALKDELSAPPETFTCD